jgi:hypothetical protein
LVRSGEAEDDAVAFDREHGEGGVAEPDSLADREGAFVHGGSSVGRVPGVVGWGGWRSSPREVSAARGRVSVGRCRSRHVKR